MSRTASSRRDASSATGSRPASAVTVAISCGSRIATVEPPPARALTTTLHGRNTPMLRSISRAWVRQVWVAGAQDQVGLHLKPALVLQYGLDVDLGQDSEALLGEGLAGASDRLAVRQVHGDAALVLHPMSPCVE